jgi:hypothetical protein
MEGEPKREFIDPNDATLESHELFPDEPSGHTGDEWDEIASKETRPTEHRLGLEEDRPLTIEEANARFREIQERIANGGRNRLPKKEVPYHNGIVSSADAQAQWERESGK